MLLEEWTWEEAEALKVKEGVEIGIEKGREKGKLEIARNALAEGAPLECVQRITGFDVDTIKALSPA
jgi:predicted transposase/invertase (TIGR01784 family)